MNGELPIIDSFNTVITLSRMGKSYDVLCDKGYFIFRSIEKDVVNPPHQGVYSVNCAFEGREYYFLKNSIYTLDHSRYLILNPGTERSSNIKSPRNVESFSVNFSPQFVREYYNSYNDYDLVEGSVDDAGQIQFFEQLHDHDYIVSPGLFRIRHLLNRPNLPDRQMRIEEEISDLLGCLFYKHQVITQTFRNVPVGKSMKIELHKRMLRARDYILSCYQRNVTITELAGVTCLNRHYFQREFKRTFGYTPHSYIQMLRAKEIVRLLKTTDNTLEEICHEVGYDDRTSVLRVIRTYFNCSPSEFRREKKERPSDAPVFVFYNLNL